MISEALIGAKMNEAKRAAEMAALRRQEATNHKRRAWLRPRRNHSEHVVRQAAAQETK